MWRTHKQSGHDGRNRSHVWAQEHGLHLTMPILPLLPLKIQLVGNRDQHWIPKTALFVEEINQPLNSKLTLWNLSIPRKPAIPPPGIETYSRDVLAFPQPAPPSGMYGEPQPQAWKHHKASHQETSSTMVAAWEWAHDQWSLHICTIHT